MLKAAWYNVRVAMLVLVRQQEEPHVLAAIAAAGKNCHGGGLQRNRVELYVISIRGHRKSRK
jgi:hypothetical protein